ncbi:tetratricopeptide repeat protein [Micromonospora sp. NPDC004704]
MSQPPPLPAVRRNAQALADAGDSPGARRLLAQAIEAGRPAYGEDDREVLATGHLLARLHVQADDPAAARRVLEEALAAGLRRWGDGDPLLLAISFDLGTVAEELGNRHEARRNFTRVATAGPAALGVDHWTVRAAREYLGESPSPGGTGAVPEPATVTFPASGTGTAAGPSTFPASRTGTAAGPSAVGGAGGTVPNAPVPVPPLVDGTTTSHPPVAAWPTSAAPSQATPPHATPRFTSSPSRTAPALPGQRVEPAPIQPKPVQPTPPQPTPTQSTATQRIPAQPVPTRPDPSTGEPTPQVTYTDVVDGAPTRAVPVQRGWPVSDPEATRSVSAPQLPPYQVITTSPPAAPAPGPASRGHGAVIAAGIAAAVAVLAAIVVVVVTLLNAPATPNNGPPAGPDAEQSAGADPDSGAGGSPPTNLALRDEGTAITITWVDSSGGTVSFIVAGARSGQQLGPMATLKPGSTKHTVNGLSATVDYCFTVVAVYSTEVVATSEQVCTKRG